MFLGGIEEIFLYFTLEIWRDRLPLAKFLEVWQFLIASSPCFGKIGFYGLIRLDFVVWIIGRYNLPFSRFPKNKGISERLLALPPGINCMGSSHICIGFKLEICYLSGWRFVRTIDSIEWRFFFIPSRKTLIPWGSIYLSYLESSCLFPLDRMKKRARDASGGATGGASCLEQKKSDVVIVIPTHSEGATRGFGGE